MLAALLEKSVVEKVAKSVKLVNNVSYTTIPSKAKAMCRDFTPPT